MTRISLFDRDHIEETADAGFERPNSLHVGQPSFFDPVPHLSGTNHTLRERVIRWRPAGARDTQNRVVTVVDAFDPKHGRVFHLGTVVTEPLAERPIRLDVSRMNESFDGDFGVGRKG